MNLIYSILRSYIPHKSFFKQILVYQNEIAFHPYVHVSVLEKYSRFSILDNFIKLAKYLACYRLVLHFCDRSVVVNTYKIKELVYELNVTQKTGSYRSFRNLGGS